MIIPTPSPSITPPKHTARIVSEVAFSSGLNISTNTENTAMEYPALTMNIRPSCLDPIIRNGTFKTIVRILSDTPVRLLIIIPIPMTPPSRMVFGTRNSSIANAAITAPRVSITNSSRHFSFFVILHHPSYVVFICISLSLPLQAL